MLAEQTQNESKQEAITRLIEQNPIFANDAGVRLSVQLGKGYLHIVRLRVILNDGRHGRGADPDSPL